MNEGRLKILAMLEDGKVTAEEAVELLRQFPEDAPPPPPPPPPAFNRQPSGWQNDIADGLKEVHDSISNANWAGILDEVGNDVKSALRDVHESLSEVFGENIFVVGPRERSNFNFVSDEVGNGIKSIKLKGKNAPVIIRAHDQNNIAIRGEYIAKYKDDAPHFNMDAGNVEITYDSNAMHSVHIFCEVPRLLIERLQVENKNGTIEVSGIKAASANLTTKNSKIKLSDVDCPDLNAKTKNAKITAEDVTSETLSLETGNAKIELENVQAATIRAETSNAAIKVEKADFRQLSTFTSNSRTELRDLLREPWGNDNSEREIDTHTTNGSISIELPRDISRKIQASTSRGKINCGNTEEMEFDNLSQNYVTGKSHGYDEAEKRLRLNVSTSNGSVSIR